MTVFLILILISCSTVQTVSQSSIGKPEPDLQFEEVVYDFGIAGTEQKIRHTFKFTNNSSETLKIIKLSTSCGCTAAISPESEILPGGMGEIQAMLETKRYEGKQEATINVYTSAEPEKPVTVLTMQGVIKKDIAIVPQGVNFGKMKKGQTGTRQVRILQLSQEPLVLKKIEANEQFLDIGTSTFNEENISGINVNITLKPQSPSGQLNEVITFHTNVQNHPRIDVFVIGNITDE